MERFGKIEFAALVGEGGGAVLDGDLDEFIGASLKQGV